MYAITGMTGATRVKEGRSTEQVLDVKISHTGMAKGNKYMSVEAVQDKYPFYAPGVLTVEGHQGANAGTIHLGDQVVAVFAEVQEAGGITNLKYTVGGPPTEDGAEVGTVEEVVTRLGIT